MGERKGQNHYYPPDFNPVKHGSLNGYHKTHALRERARKLSQGILIIRFEMPYNIWCDGCKNHIGMGVRYNAEKKKVGNYYTTPIYRFKMKCHLCVNYIEMQTDPATCDYVIVTGGSRKEERWDMAENEQIITTEHKEKEKLETDAMFKLDHGGKDKEKMKKALPSLSEIQDYQASKKDDFQLNSSLRRRFRTEKKVIAEQEEKDNMVRLRTNLSIPLLPEKEEDKKLAALLTYQAPDSYDDKQHIKRKEISSRSWFTSPSPTPGSPAGSLLHKLGLQGKEAAVAKALSSSQSALIRRRSAGPRIEPRTEPCATATRRNSNPEINTCEGEEMPSISPTEMCQDVTETNGSRETHVKTTEEGVTTTKDSGKEKERGRSLGALTSIMADYSDSDSDS
ncbi:coiled-coil domain-containing protein 130 homolog [Trematomus bernacchii]|uniref:Probable splicing factor YJU2B n=1 Tax=Pagothenia borchgrevinki TaxID=8213 RepID=A0ABD2HJQ0_PAGBO|nr:coiled-coil domain-containing protein 130 homolog [Trematomus bernacchii]